MYIERIETFQVPPRWIFVRVETQDEWVGWGEAILPKRVQAVRGAVADIAANVLGSPAGAIEDVWQRVFRGAFFRRGPVLMTALAAIEQALWDIKGKRYGLPVHEFLGGRVRQHVRAYAWIGGDQPDDVVAQAKARKAQGYSAVKMNATAALNYLDDHEKLFGVIGRVDALRSAMGPDFGIALDFHGRVHRAMAKALLHELAPYRPLWVEEPLLPEHWDSLPQLSDTPIPLAAGERWVDRWDFKHALEQRILAIIQPDVSFTGLHELEKIARMAEAYDVVVAPHCPNGPISLAATLQVDACVPNVVWQEHSYDLHYHQGYGGLPKADLGTYLQDPAVLMPKGGVLAVPDGPGLGIAVDEDKVRQADQRWQLRDPDWRNADGTVAEW